MARGILDLIGLAGVLVFAVPLGLLGLQFVIDGRGIGWLLLLAAVLMILFEERVTTPRDLPGAAAERAAERAFSPADDADAPPVDDEEAPEGREPRN